MCETNPSMPCVWLRIYERAEKLGRVDRLITLQPPLDWQNYSKSSWTSVLKRLVGRGEQPQTAESGP